MQQEIGKKVEDEIRDVRLLGDTWDWLDSMGLVIGETRYSLADVVVFAAVALAIYVGAKLFFWLIKKGIRKTGKFDPVQKLLLEKITGLIVIAIAFFLGAKLVGFDLSTLAFFSGAMGLAIGFGLQKTFGNLIAGLILLMDRSVKPGDVIVVGDHFGAISKIGIRAVSVITRDGKEHLIPNELLMTEPVENWSYSSRNVRVQIPVGVSYSSDIERVEEILLECVHSCERVLKTPKATVWLKEFGDNSVNFEIQAWIKDPEAGVGNVRSATLKAVWHAFKKEGIEIPFPQRDLHLRSVDDAVAIKTK